VKLWSEQNQRLAATVSQFHSLDFELFVFGGVFGFSRSESSESLTANSKQQKAVFGLDCFLQVASLHSQRIELTAKS
jgi:hypothetical protein